MSKKELEANIRDRYEKVRDALNERARRLFAASEALVYGYGGIATVSRATGIARKTIGKGLKELKEIEAGQEPDEMKGRIRRPGGGRKKATEKDPTLLPDLKELVELSTRGDPESPLLWTARSLRNLVVALADKGHKVTPQTVSSLLKQLGYSLQSNRKRLEGSQHPDRNAQFEHINEEVRRQLEANEPVISVDTKKRELVGTYKNAGRELRPKQDPEVVRVHDFVEQESRSCYALRGL